MDAPDIDRGRADISSNGMMSGVARSCSDTVSVPADDDGRRDILVSKRKVQALDDKE